ncbi:MAG: DUF2066 domain-containing protein [Lysobacteraceae bacterium]
MPPIQSTTTTLSSRPARAAFVRFLAALCLLTISLGSTAQSIDLYEGETSVEDQSEGARSAALPQALANVAIKLSGDLQVAQNGALSSGLANASQWIQNFRYREDARIENGAAVRTQTLIARFQPDAVDRWLRDAGVAVWSVPRPAVTVWLGIDDGRGARLVAEAQANAVNALTKRAADRGIALLFPLLDIEDQSAIQVDQVWREDLSALRAASARYDNRAVLAGRLQRNDNGWSASWVLVDGDEVVQRWSDAGLDATALLARAGDVAIDGLAKRYAHTALIGTPGRYRIVVSDVGSALDYAQMNAYLRSLALVRSLQVDATQDGLLWLTLDLAAGLESLDASLAVSRQLVPAGQRVDETPVYRWQP